jgi:hypothetical protein
LLPDNPEKRWYVRDHIAGQPRQVWLFDERTATCVGVTNAEGGAGTHFKAEPGEDIWDCIRRQTPWLNPDVTEGHFHLMTLGPAEFYPRIARPIALATRPMLWSPPITTYKAFIASARIELTLLVRRLEIICQTVQPSTQTLDVYGHEIRNLLILAATEAEMHWRGILSVNNASIQQFNSNEYVKLVGPLRLHDYRVMFHDFPDLGPVSPFAGWTKTDPTKSLAWYDAYNGVKHNREVEFYRGTLRRAFEAVSACVAMLVAQFGPTALNTELSGFVELQVPTWPIGDMYLPQVTDADWTPVQHPDI